MDMDTNTDDIKYIKTNGGTALLWQTYKFHRHKGYKNGSVLWSCTSFKGQSVQNDIITKTKDHTCGRDAFANDRLLVTNALRNKVITSDQPIPTVYEDNVFTLKEKGHDLMNAIPKFKNIKQLLYDARNKELGVPATIFKSINEVTVPVRFRESILADYYYDGTLIGVLSQTLL